MARLASTRTVANELWGILGHATDGTAGRLGFAAALLAVVLFVRHPATAAERPFIGTVAGSVGADLLWAGHTAVEDAKAILTAPLHIGELANVTGKQLLIGALAIGSIGGTITLDETIAAHARNIGTHDGRLLETTGSTVSLSSVGALYLGGLVTDNDSWRHGALTGVESLGVTSLLVTGVEGAFGRQRPNGGKGAYAWFDGGTSFVSSATAPAFAAAESVSAAVDHDWRVTVPVYAAATAVGIGRMAQNAHWASDIVGAAWLAIGTTDALRCLHDKEENEERFRWNLGPLAGPNRAMGLQFHLRF